MSTNTGTRSSFYSQQAYHGTNRMRKFVPPKSILSSKQTGAFRIIKEGEDVTPEPLNPLRSPEGAKEQKISAYELTGDPTQSAADLKIFQTQSISRFQTELHKQTLQGHSQFQQSYISSEYADDVIIEPERKESPSGSIVIEEDEQRLGIVPGVDISPKSMPTHISLILAETPTFFLLDLPSKTVEKNTPEGKK